MVEDTLDILFLVALASGKKKQDILEKNKDNELLQKILFFVYNPHIVTGLSDKKIKKIVNKNGVDVSNDILDIFEYIKKNNTGTDKDINYIQKFIKNQPVKYQEIYKQIFTKNLKIGVTSTTINKIWKDLIPEYEVQQGRKLCERIDKISNLDIILTQKLDGIRATIRVENGNVQIFSRQGQKLEGFVELEQEASLLPNGCYDGELLKDEIDERDNNGIPKFLKMNNLTIANSIMQLLYAPMPSKDLFKLTSSIVNSDEKEKRGICIHIYDMFPLENFDNMNTYKVTTDVRKDKIEMILQMQMDKTPHLKNVPILYKGKFDEILVDNILKEVLLCEQEGLMINLKDSPYEFKRSNNLIKVKKMYPADLKIIGFEEGSGQNKNTLGAIIVDYKGYKVKVGSGFKKTERDYFWENQKDLLGKIVTVQYFEETTNKKDNSLSLRFPIFKGLRFDKTEPSYN